MPLNCFLIWNARHLARHAADLGLKADARAFAKRADAPREHLLRICHVPGEKRFWDYNHHTRTHTKVKTFWMFRPLFAGVEMPCATRDSLLKALLDPAQFFGPVPFPSVAYDETAYDARLLARPRLPAPQFFPAANPRAPRPRKRGPRRRRPPRLLVFAPNWVSIKHLHPRRRDRAPRFPGLQLGLRRVLSHGHR